MTTVQEPPAPRDPHGVELGQRLLVLHAEQERRMVHARHHLIASALRHGVTWDEIAEALDVPTQALRPAHRRYLLAHPYMRAT